MKRIWCVRRLAPFILATLSACTSPIPKSLESGFKMEHDSLKFPNFASGYDDSEMNVQLMQRMFGDVVCTGKGNDCTLTPAAKAFMNKANNAMKSGRCEGFAVASTLFANGKLDPVSFGGETARDLSLEGNPDLQREIAYWFTTQLVPKAVGDKTKAYMAKDVMSHLVDALRPDAKERFRIGIVKKQGKTVTGGHSLTPISFFEEANAKGVYDLYVYDNNNPDTIRVLKIDTKKNRWEFEASANPSVKSSLYFGDDSNKNPLYFAPVFSRTGGALPCHFCSGSGQTQINTSGGAQVSVGEGDQASGVVDGNLVSGGSAIVTPSFQGDFDERATDFDITVDSAADLSMTVTNPGSTEPGMMSENQSVTVQGEQFIASVESKMAGTNTFAVTNNGQGVSFANDAGTPVGLRTEVQRADGQTVAVEAHIDGTSSNVAATVDPMTGKVTVSAADSMNSIVTVVVSQTAADGGTATGQISYTSQGDSSADINASGLGMTGSLTGTVNNNGTMQTVSNACTDGMKSGMETDVDCGSVCMTKCAVTKSCAVGADCESGICSVNSVCVASTCADGRRSGDETDVDCGGSCSAACGVGQACMGATDCAGNTTCVSNTCRVTYVVGVAVSGLPAGDTVSLLNNASDSLNVSATGTFAFGGRVTSAYDVTISAQPATATCTVTSGSGTATGDVTVSVACTRTYALGGTVTGLTTGKSVVIQNNGGSDLTLSANGAFQFSNRISAAYVVSVLTQPVGGACVVSNGSGTPSGDVSNVTIACSDGFAIGGTVSGLGLGKSVVIQNNGGNDLTVSANGTFQFSTPIIGAYAVTVLTQPVGGNCVVSNGSGTASADVSNVTVACTDGFTIGGTLSGLPASQSVTLKNNGTDALVLSADGAFTFATRATAYNVTISAQPSGATCTVSNGAGTAMADVASVAVTCVASGVLDPTFNGSGFIVYAPTGFHQEWFKAAVNPDNSSVWVGRNQTTGTNEDWIISKIKADGTFDSSFGTGGHVSATGNVASSPTERAAAIARNADGTYFVAGTFLNTTTNADIGLVKLTAAGALDTTFGAGTGRVTIDLGQAALKSEWVQDMKVLANGKILIAGFYNSSNSLPPAGASTGFIVQLTTAGALDATFGVGGRVSYPTTPIGNDDQFFAIGVDSTTGDITAVGQETTLVTKDALVVRYNSSGALVTGFGTGGTVITDLSGATRDDVFYAVDVQGSTVAAAGSVDNGTNTDHLVAWYTATGAPNTTYGTAGVLKIDRAGGGDLLKSILFDPVSLGYYIGGNSGLKMSVGKLTAAGLVNTSFGTSGFFESTVGSFLSVAYTLVLDNAGKLLVGGTISNSANPDCGAARLTP